MQIGRFASGLLSKVLNFAVDAKAQILDMLLHRLGITARLRDDQRRFRLRLGAEILCLRVCLGSECFRLS